MASGWLDDVEARAKAATPGPWARSVKTWDGEEIMTVVAPAGQDDAEIVQEPTYFSAYPSGAFVTPSGEVANLEFVAAARADVPELVACLREAMALLERADLMGEPTGAIGEEIGRALEAREAALRERVEKGP